MERRFCIWEDLANLKNGYNIVSNLNNTKVPGCEKNFQIQKVL